MRWTRWLQALLRKTTGVFADGKAVWSWPPDAEVKLAEMIRRRRGQESPVPRGVRGISRKPLRREGRIVPSSPVVLYPCAFYSHRGPRVWRTPGLPCALVLPRAGNAAQLGQIMPRDCSFMFRELARHSQLSCPASIGASSIPEALV